LHGAEKFLKGCTGFSGRFSAVEFFFSKNATLAKQRYLTGQTLLKRGVLKNPLRFCQHLSQHFKKLISTW